MSSVLRLMSSNSSRGVLDILLRRYEAHAGRRIELQVDTAKATRLRVLAGEPSAAGGAGDAPAAAADAVVLSTPMLRELEAAGRVEPGSLRPFGRARIGVGVRLGWPKPDIGSVQALREALRAARAIAHTREGASGRYIPELLERLGIAAELRGRIVTREGGPIGPVVVAGEADLALQQLPELLGVPGLEVVGLIPEPVQRSFETSSAVLAGSSQPRAARELLDFLVRAEHRAVFEAGGLEPLGLS